VTIVHVGRCGGAPDVELLPGDNLYIGESTVRRMFGGLTSLEQDLLTLAGGIYAADLAVKRDTLTSVVRTIEVHVEVVNIAHIRPQLRKIEHCLHFLSNDNWTIHLVAKSGRPEPTQPWPRKDGVVLLFSGGLDSFVAGFELAHQDLPFVLVSHATHNQVTQKAQAELHAEISSQAKNTPKHLTFRIFGRKSKTADFPQDALREESQRTRSFLFLTLASISARREGLRTLVNMAENGQFAIHLPLSAARVGPFSTHTAHPEFLRMAEDMFAGILDMPGLKITNPYLYFTKGEVVARLPKQRHNLIPRAVSCWRSSRVRTCHHCGECLPCLSRRIAVESAGSKFSEYERDLFSEDISTLPHDDLGKRNLVELAEFIGHFSGRLSSTETELIEQYPELLNSHFDQAKGVAMYRRFAAEATTVLQRYPKTRWLVQ
jgi:7-cyano-7-deazaguanine synthase in queuosine biosynthesis